MSILDRFSLQGKTVLITGGAGLYGRQIVSAIAGAGAKTYIASRNLASIEEVAEAQRAAGYDVTALPVDQGDESSVLALRDELQRRGQLDVLVNNAVLRPMRGGFHDDVANFDESMRINATGLFVISRALGDLIAESGNGGSIINIGSIHGVIGPDPTIYRGTEIHGWYPDYFFHKGGMLNFTRFLASYYGAKNIRCNYIAAGGFDSGQTETFVRQYSERTCLGRLANDEDLQGIVVFLASDASAYVTGANIAVDGGYTVR